NINTGWGGNTVNAQETFGTLNVTSGGSDTVNVGDAGSVQDVLGTLNIENPTSTTTLNIDDSADTTVLPNVALDTFTPSAATPWCSITGLAPAVINHTRPDASPISNTTGVGADTVIVPPDGVKTINGSASGADTVNVGNGGSVQSLLGTLNIENPSSV